MNPEHIEKFYSTKQLSPDHPINGLPDTSVSHFWSWAYSDILSNRNRAVFAEFVVGSLLGIMNEPRIEWDAVDLRYKGKTLEVKSAAYLQSWIHTKPSVISYGISKKKAWYAETGLYAPEPLRAADCYVFCLFTAKDRKSADIMNLTQWEFRVISSNEIGRKLGDQKRVSLSKLNDFARPVNHRELKSSIDRVLDITY